MATLVADVDLARTTGDRVPLEVKLHLRGTGALRFATNSPTTASYILDAATRPRSPRLT